MKLTMPPRRRATIACRSSDRRLYLEVLEERLPPGAWFLGSMVGSSLLGQGPWQGDEAPWAAEINGSEAIAVNHRTAGPGDSFRPETDWPSPLAIAFAPLQSQREPGAFQGGSAASGSTQLFVENSSGAVPTGSPNSLLGIDALLASPFAGPAHAPGGFGRGPNAAGYHSSPGSIEGLSAGGRGGTVSAGAADQAAAGGFGMGQPMIVGAGANGITNAGPPMSFVQPAASVGRIGNPSYPPQGLTAAGPGGTAAPDPHQQEVHAGFDLATPTGGPFPSNQFTVPDHSQNTGRRVNLPLPDPSTNLSDYQDTQVLNTLDGFNLQPRLSIPFDGAIDVNSVNSSTVFLVSLGDTLDHHDHGGQVVGINQVVWDVATTSLHVESDGRNGRSRSIAGDQYRGRSDGHPGIL